MFARSTALALAGLLFMAGAASAQQDRYAAGLQVIIADPVVEFETLVDIGGGLQLFGRVPLDPAGILSLRGDLGFLIYGYESKRVCSQGVGCRVEARLQTSNNIFFGGIGPELALPTRSVRPYVNAT